MHVVERACLDYALLLLHRALLPPLQARLRATFPAEPDWQFLYTRKWLQRGSHQIEPRTFLPAGADEAAILAQWHDPAVTFNIAFQACTCGGVGGQATVGNKCSVQHPYTKGAKHNTHFYHVLISDTLPEAKPPLQQHVLLGHEFPTASVPPILLDMFRNEWPKDGIVRGHGDRQRNGTYTGPIMSADDVLHAKPFTLAMAAFVCIAGRRYPAIRRKALESLDMGPPFRLPDGVSRARRARTGPAQQGFPASPAPCAWPPAAQSSEGMKTATNPPTLAASAITSRAAILDRRMSR